MKNRGFTLLELVVVIVITGILAAVLTVFLKPAVDSYFDTRRRAEITDMADTALRRMSKDIHSAVPNSINSVSATCFQLVPTIAGGRYRMATDIVNAGSAVLDTSTTTSSFDVLSPLSTVPAIGDWIVVGNQNTGDVYAGNDRAAITQVQKPPPAPGGANVGQYRISINPTQFPVGYDGGRFVVVPNAEQSVFYSCSGGRLYRIVNTFGANQANSCNLTSGAASLVASDVASCEFDYSPNQGATQQSGFVWMRLQLSSSGENIVLSHGAHVDNVP